MVCLLPNSGLVARNSRGSVGREERCLSQKSCQSWEVNSSPETSSRDSAQSWLVFFFFLIFYFFICGGFCHTLKWNSHGVYMCSPSRSPLPPPSPPAPSRFSQCTRSEHLSHASNLGWWLKEKYWGEDLSESSRQEGGFCVLHWVQTGWLSSGVTLPEWSSCRVAKRAVGGQRAYHFLTI